MAKQKVLVTGGTGFLGRQILAGLRNADVDVVTVSRGVQLIEGVQSVALDLLSQAAVAEAVEQIRPDIVVHNAWFVEHGAFWNSLDNLDWVAAAMTLARACLRTRVKRFVGVGTCYEYDWPAAAPCDELTTPIVGHLLYDKAKAAVRDLLATAFRDTDVSFAWGRIFFLFGPSEHPARLVASIARALAADEPARCSRGLAVRDFMDVRDAGGAVAALVRSDVTGDVNVATGDPVRIADLARTMGEIVGRPDLIHLGSYPDRPEPPYIVGMNGRLAKEVGFVPKHTLRSGLDDAVAFWRRVGR